MKRTVLPLLVISVLAAAMCWQSAMPECAVCELEVPRLGEISGFTSEAREASDAERTVLPDDTLIQKRHYTAANGDWFLVTAVVSGRGRGSIHRPELCLPAQGFLMTSPHRVTVAGADWRALVLAGPAGATPLGFAYTFFNQEGYRTASHVRRIFRDVWDRSFHARIDRWVMITVCASRADDVGLVDFLERLTEVVE